MAGLLTYSTQKRLPIIVKITVVKVFVSGFLSEFTAAGLFGTCTRFPFIACLVQKQRNLLRRKSTRFFSIESLNCDLCDFICYLLVV
jgi:hypothetical protein